MKLTTFTVALATFAAPAFAESHEMALQGDAAAGEEEFNSQCIACHVVQDPETDEVLAGRNAKVGPNLYGINGRAPGTVEGFNYSDALVALGEGGMVWGEASFAAYVQDPTGYLREVLEDRRARGKMAYRVRDEEQAFDIYAYLSTFGPADAEPDAEATN